jgi:hypothetical protein
MLRRYLILPTLMIIAVAAASPEPRSSCVASLQPQERMIHDAAAARVRAGAALQSALRAAAVALVREGKLAMRAAPNAAQAAARCLTPKSPSGSD